MYRNVLVVDDNPFDRKILSALLEKINFVPIECADAFEALDEIETKKLDLIFLDIKMPKCNGFELLKRLGNYSLRNQVPIIMMSANRLDKEGVLCSFKFGASDFLVKPIQSEALYGKIEKLRQSNKLHKQIKVELPDSQASVLKFQTEIAHLEDHGLTVITNYPLVVGESFYLENDFLKKYGIDDLKVIVEITNQIKESFHSFVSFKEADEKKVETIQAIYSSLLESSQKSLQENFRSEA